MPSDLYPDALPCLRALAAAGYLVGIAGNQPAEVEAFLREPRRAARRRRLVRVVGRREALARVLRPRCRRELVSTPGEIAYVGDRVDNDVVPAADAGMVAVHVRRGPWGHLQADWPDVGRAAIRIDTLAELLPALQHRERPVRLTPAPRAS